jgi:hypothetical protein
MARRAGAIRTARQHSKLTASQRATYERYLQARRNQRSGMSFTRAAREAHISPQTLRRLGGSDFQQHGRRVISARDRSYRLVNIIDNRGIATVQVSRRDASTAGRYDAAVRRYLRTGDVSELHKFRGTVIGGHEFETDTDALDERAARGELEDFEFYALAQ